MAPSPNGTLPQIMVKRTLRMSMGPDGKRPKTQAAVETNTQEVEKKTQEVRVSEAWRAVRERKAKLQEILRSLGLQSRELKKDQRRLKEALFDAMPPLRKECFVKAREILKQEGLKCAVCGRRKERCFDPECRSAIGLLRIAASYKDMTKEDLDHIVKQVKHITTVVV